MCKKLSHDVHDELLRDRTRTIENGCAKENVGWDFPHMGQSARRGSRENGGSEHTADIHRRVRVLRYRDEFRGTLARTLAIAIEQDYFSTSFFFSREIFALLPRRFVHARIATIVFAHRHGSPLAHHAFVPCLTYSLYILARATLKTVATNI